MPRRKADTAPPRLVFGQSQAAFPFRVRHPGGGWLFFLVTCVCLAISASYELFEWAMAVAAGSKADAFLGTQGDPWDTQRDMLWALIGALTSQLLLARLHERQLVYIRRGAPESDARAAPDPDAREVP
jgi:hypothetical protein